jgi:hypothetical protein
MLETLLPLLLILAACYAWQDALKARERARLLSHELCAHARVQLLDQTVALQRLGVARGTDGWLHLRRRYRFEISTDGVDRHHGTLELMDGELLSHSLPLGPESPASVSNVVELHPRATLTPPRH